MIVRLSKYLADCGICARRKAEQEILDGKVFVNGKLVNELGTKVDTWKDKVTYEGKPVSSKSKFVYILLHKPVGYVSTVKDEQNRPTIMSLVKNVNARLVPVGRLDYNTSGLLLMTNDGALTYKLTHPKHEVEKTYLAKIDGFPSKQELQSFRSGLYIEDSVVGKYKTAPARIFIVNRDERSTLVKILIKEGRNRQVRKMCEAISHRVINLKRIATGNIALGDLETGKYRHLTKDEINYLKKL